MSTMRTPDESPPGNDMGTTTAMVEFATSKSAAEVWQALTEPTCVECWFGRLTPGLHPVGSARLDFGDGDFFILRDIELDPPNLVRYNWRFLGIGPLDNITWRITPKDVGCLVTVSDIELERSREAVQEMEEGWLDFVRRLDGFLSTGVTTRYDWRREFEGSIELPKTIQLAFETLLSPQKLAEWLPLGESYWKPGIEFTRVDNLTSPAPQITDLACEPPTRMQFQLTQVGWQHSTSCQLELHPRQKDTILAIRHTGWETISQDDDYQRHQRLRFSTFWITALQRARQLLE